eukprot:scaffold9815_cov87-Skeletonema_dohrnii-CCMP3373.AAC.4
MVMLPLLLLLSSSSPAWAFSVAPRRSPVAISSGDSRWCPVVAKEPSRLFSFDPFKKSYPSYRNHPSYSTTWKKNKSSLQLSGSSSSESSTTTTTSPTRIQEALAGLTVAFSLLSKAIACSAIVGVNPLVGLWSSVIMGITAPLIGSRAGVISGTAAVVIVPLSALTVTHGVEYMPLCIILSAILQGLFGVFNLAKTADLVSEEVLSGFLNGLGFILLFSQAKVFKAAKAGGALLPAVGMASLCFSIVQLLPLVTKAVPSSLVGLVVATGLGMMLKLPLATLESTAPAGTFSGGLSSLPSLIDFGQLRSMATSSSAVKLVMPAAISIMIIALVETLLAGKVVDDMTGKTDDADYDVPKRSVLAMSTGNLVSAFLGGFGGCGLIPQTVLNLKSGGGGPFSSISYALAMASFVLFFAPLVGKISEAALAGIMITVAYDTVAWSSSFKSIKAVMAKGGDGTRVQRLIDLFALGLSSYICYFGNLAVGIIGGVVAQRGLHSIFNRVSKD